MLGSEPLTKWARASLLGTLIKVRGARGRPHSMLGGKGGWPEHDPQ